MIRLLGAAAGAAVILAVPYGTAHVHARTATIQVVAVTTRAQQSLPPAGREGDAEQLRWSVRDRFGRSIGAAVFSCRWQLAQTRLCYGELRLPLGKLAIIGASPTRSVGEWAVVGGTGRYVAASGVMRFHATGLRRLTLTLTI